MMEKTTITIIIVVLLALALFSYNHILKLENEAEGKWAQVENQYQRRAELIPQVVEISKTYLEHEETIFNSINKARQDFLNAVSKEEKIDSANMLDKEFSKLIASSYDYPELKSNEQFVYLMTEIEGTQNRISLERKRYNEAVNKYNFAIKKIPYVVFAGLFGFGEKSYFKADKSAELAPEIELKEEKNKSSNLILSASEKDVYVGEETKATLTFNNPTDNDLKVDLSLEVSSGVSVTDVEGCAISNQNFCKDFFTVPSKASVSLSAKLRCENKIRVFLTGKALYNEITETEKEFINCVDKQN